MRETVTVRASSSTQEQQQQLARSSSNSSSQQQQQQQQQVTAQQQQQQHITSFDSICSSVLSGATNMWSLPLPLSFMRTGPLGKSDVSRFLRAAERKITAVATVAVARTARGTSASAGTSCSITPWL